MWYVLGEIEREFLCEKGSVFVREHYAVFLSTNEREREKEI